MRIGRIMIDTDNMSEEELTVIINELRTIRKRKQEARTLINEFTEVLTKAKDMGFTFVDKDFGQVIMGTDFMIYDEKGTS